MAEIILPPEENEETPQAPELNIDKPTENSKVITIEFEAKKTNKVSTKDTNQQLYTTDTDAWFEFKETTLENANGTYSVVFRNRHDGSIFQRTGDVVNGVAYYKIPHQEIRHAGAWRGQLVYTLENGNTTAREFDYVVKGHILDGKDVREIVVEDFETLMSQLNSMKDNVELELADLVNAAGRNELERQQFYESLVEDINDLQENYQELLDTGVLQTNINEKLGELEEEYAPKLNEVTAQLAQKADDYVVRKRTEPIRLNDMDESVLNAIAGGENTNFTIEGVPRDFSVGPDKTTFARRGINKFDGIYNRYTLRTDGTIGESDVARSAIIRITGGKTYHFRKEGGDRRRLGFHKSEPTPTEESVDYFVGDITPGEGYTAPEDANYAIYYVSNSSETPNAQITEGKDYPFFVGYDVNINLENKSQTLDLLEEGDRIRDVLSLQRAYLYSSDIQIKIDYRDKTVVIPEGTRVFYGGKRNIISNEGETLSFEGFEQTFVIYFDIENNEVGLTTISFTGKIPDNVAVIGIVHPFRPLFNGLDENQVEVNGEMFIPNHVKEYVEQHSPDPNIQKYFLLESIQEIYSKPNNVPDTSSDSEIPLESSNHQLIYDKFDSFTENDNRWTKTNLGEDTVGNPIYEYTYKPLTFDNNSRFTDKRIKIMILSSIHGYEQMAGWATTLFFEDLTSAKEEESALGFMARNIEFKVVPVGNPGGFDNNARTNANGVDLNRNFDVNFNVSGTPTEGYNNGYYSGPYAESEVETQILSDWVRNNTDADFFIDYHNIAGTAPMSYVRNDNQATMFSSLWRSLTHKWVKDYSLPERTHSFGHISDGGLGARLAVFAGSQGIEYALLETPWRISFASKKYDKITAETAIDSLGNLLTVFCKSVS